MHPRRIPRILALLAIPALLCGGAGILRAQEKGETLPAADSASIDFPANVPHGTWDFDEWPGVDHEAVYEKNFVNNRSDSDRIKIDYAATSFDADDHEGYLKEPGALRKHGFEDIRDLLRAGEKGRVLLGIFTHPDDDLLLAGGLLSAAKREGWDVRVFLMSNGADGSLGESDTASPALGGYNAIGIRRDLSLKIVTDARGEENEKVVAQYAAILGVPVKIARADFFIAGKRIVRFGDAAGTDSRSTFIPGGVIRGALEQAIDRIVAQAHPAILVTHGSDGEYGNAYHRAVREAALDAGRRAGIAGSCLRLGGFPEYNFHDQIRYFLDLDAEGGEAHRLKWEALKAVPALFRPGANFDAVWNPAVRGSPGVFMKDYGYTARDGYPPRYEFFSVAE